jgi:hypothetical protein
MKLDKLLQIAGIDRELIKESKYRLLEYNDAEKKYEKQYTRYFYADDKDVIRGQYDLRPGWDWEVDGNFEGASDKTRYPPNEQFQRLLPQNVENGSKIVFFLNLNGWQGSPGVTDTYHIEHYERKNYIWEFVDIPQGPASQIWLES